MKKTVNNFFYLQLNDEHKKLLTNPTQEKTELDKTFSSLRKEWRDYRDKHANDENKTKFNRANEIVNHLTLSRAEKMSPKKEEIQKENLKKINKIMVKEKYFPTQAVITKHQDNAGIRLVKATSIAIATVLTLGIALVAYKKLKGTYAFWRTDGEKLVENFDAEYSSYQIKLENLTNNELHFPVGFGKAEDDASKQKPTISNPSINQLIN